MLFKTEPNISGECAEILLKCVCVCVCVSHQLDVTRVIYTVLGRALQFWLLNIK